MASRPKPNEEVRVPLSRDRVLRTAIDLADAIGLEALTMRRLAQELGVEAMTLYYYVANKEEIRAGMADLVVGEIEIPADDVHWKAALRTIAVSAYESLIRHPWAAGLVLSSGGSGPARLDYMEAILGTLRRGGFSTGLTDHGYHAIESHIMGFTLWEVGMNLGSRENLAAMATDFLNELSTEEFPHIAEHVHWHLGGRPPEDQGEFEFGLDLILNGLERLRPA